jgi:hypothetical protein
MDQLVFILDSLNVVFAVILAYWWIWLPLILFFVFWGSMVAFNRAQYLAGLKWTLLEVRFPAEAHKSFNAMEQIFVSLHASGPPPKSLKDKWNKFKDTYFNGKVPNWYSFEIVGDSAEIHFYIRFPEDSRNLIESQIYGHYPDAELYIAPDYVLDWPTELPNEEFDTTAVELALVKENIFPIKTYPEFEEEHPGKDDVKRIDPLAPLIQAISMLSFAERVALQVLIRPTGTDWVKKDQAAMDKLLEKPAKPEVSGVNKAFDAFESTLGSVVGAAPAEAPKEDKKDAKPFNQLPPGTQDLVKAIEHGTSLLAFETGIRILYIARREGFDKNRLGSVVASFKQFSTSALNSFKPGFAPEVRKGRNKEQKTFENKQMLAKRYRSREFPEKPFVFNTEELTTVYHFPDVGVKTPALPRVEAKKGEPPAGLPTV